MDRKFAYLTLQKIIAEQMPPGPMRDAWLEWLDAVYAGDVDRPHPPGPGRIRDIPSPQPLMTAFRRETPCATRRKGKLRIRQEWPHYGPRIRRKRLH